MKSINILRVTIGTLLILSIPLLAKAPWTTSDFVIAGALLFGTGSALELTANRVQNRKNKIITLAAILFLALYIWAELAVGIFTTLGS